MRKVQILVMLLALLAGLGWLYQWQKSSTDRLEHPAPGRFIDVGRLTLHLDCRGHGSPTLILEAGLTSGSASWGLVHDALSHTTQVCAYDRPGMDWSQPSNAPASATQIGARLHQLLSAANLSGPKILVGMSAGGVFVREYWRQHPGDVVGMVLVDSSHEEQQQRLPNVDALNNMDLLFRLCSWVQPLGIIRATGVIERYAQQYQLPNEINHRLVANMNQSYSCGAMLQESQGFELDLALAQAPSTMGNLPLLVLSQGIEPTGVEALGWTDAMAQEQRVVWDQLQLELTGLSSSSRRVIASQSGHVIQFDQPQLVIQEINRFVQQVRASQGNRAVGV